MPALRDIALTIEERTPHQFHWVLMEALHSEAAEAIYYRRIQSAATAQSSYSNALALGAHALRRLVESDPAGA